MNTIRPARPEDAPAIAEIYVETWQTSYAGMVPSSILIKMSPAKISKSWQRAIEHQQSTILVMVNHSQTVIGFGSTGSNRDKASPFDSEIYTLYIHPDFQNQGNGRLLLHNLFQANIERGFRHCELWVLAANPSRFFYHAMGGKICGEKYESLWGEKIHQLAYGWENIHTLETIQTR